MQANVLEDPQEEIGRGISTVSLCGDGDELYALGLLWTPYCSQG